MIDHTSLLKSDEENLPSKLIGVGVQVTKDKHLHSVLYIRYNNKGNIFHYDGNSISIDALRENDWVFFREIKDLEFFIPPILSYFRNVIKISKPQYAYYYAGALYDTKGNFKDELGLPEYFTCVGFCLAVLKNILMGEDLLKYTDWKPAHGKDDDYVSEFYENIKTSHPKLTIEEFRKGVRRITPLEYFTAGFSESRPASKSFTDLYKPEIRGILKEYLKDWPSS